MADERAPAPAAEHDGAGPAAEIERLRDRWLRARADLENYRKRSDQEVDRRVFASRDRLLGEWFEVVDSIDRALQYGSVADAPLRELRRQMLAVLERQGVQRIDSEDATFDPEVHEAIGVRRTDEAPSGTVVEVARAGYRAGDRVLRPAQVIVARRPAAEEAV